MDEDLRNRMRGQRHDYTRPAYRPAPTPGLASLPTPQQPKEVNTPETVSQPSKPPKTRFFRRRRFIAVLLVLLILGGVSGWSIWHSKSTRLSPIPQSVRKQLSIALYYPTNLPSGWTVDNTSFKIPAPQVLTYVVRDNSSDVFNISEQAIPASFDFSAFQKKFSAPDNFSAPAGDTLVGQVGSNLICSIRTTANTWLIVNTANLSIKPTLETLCRSLSQLK